MSNLTVSDFRDWSGNANAPATEWVQAAIDAAEQAINDHCARQFVVADAEDTSTRNYVPDGTGLLRIHDCVAVTAITDNGSTVASTAYQLEPLNNLSSSGLTVPYDQVRRLSGAVWTCDYGKATVAVTARWGWSALPAQYTEATKVLAKDIVGQIDITGGGFSIDIDKVADLLARLRRVESWGIA